MFLLKVIALTTMFFSAIEAQSEIAACGPGYDWNKNSLGQDPCNVTALIQSSCNNLVYEYQALNASEAYPVPNSNNSCECNTVLYSLLMACTCCQGGNIYSWRQWQNGCNVVYVSYYPANIPYGTAIPNWAYYDYTSLPDETYNDTVAMNAGRDPERTPNQPSTVSLPPTTSSNVGSSSFMLGSSTGVISTAIGLPGGPSNPTDTSNPTKSKKNLGAVVGGVVGSVALLGIIVTVALWYMQRCRLLQPGRPQLLQEQTHDEGLYGQPSGLPLSGGQPMSSVPLTIYDPTNPFTFPPSRLPSLALPNTPSNPTATSNTRVTYPGVPEL